jgi:hypothetical protein
MRTPIGSPGYNPRILLVRGQRIILDADLAALYGVETRVLNQAVRRNNERFPQDFMLELSRAEIRNISQFVICSGDLPGLKHSKRVTAFTENGVAMLSGVLSSPRAIQANIEIMRAFTRLRGAQAIHRSVLRKLAALERKVHGHEDQLQILAEAIGELEGVAAEESGKQIGFKPEGT